MKPNTIEWHSYTHKHKGKKTQDWYWALGFVAVSVAVASILFNNILFGLLIIMAAVTIGLSANSNREPQENLYKVTTRGVIINDTLYSYKNLEAFWIDESNPNKNILLIDAKQLFMPHLIIDLPDSVDIDAVQDYLLDYLPEEELYEHPAQRIAEMFGF